MNSSFSQIIFVLGLFSLASPIFGLLSLLPSIDLSFLQTKYTTKYYLKNYGYDLEEHKVTTTDKYILTLHRVKCPKTVQNEAKPRPVVFLQHGLLCSSALFVVVKNQSLGLTLCDLGYDIWIGNFRGNQYSSEHKYLSIYDPKYWTFSWHEIALNDLPAMIEYTLKVTKQDNLTYVGHSQGTTTMFVLASTRPNWAAAKIKSFHAISPVVFMEHVAGVFAAIAPALGQPDAKSRVAEYPLLPNTVISGILGKTVCLLGEICENLLNLIFGKSEIFNGTYTDDLLQIFPAGSSFRQLKHYLQGRISKEFRQFDFTREGNQLVYNSTSIPTYNLAVFNLPVFFYYGGKDYLAAVPDVHRLFESLNSETILDISYFDDFNHMDFFFSNDKELSNFNAIITDNIAKL